jgi:hypothetical protein
VIVSQSFEMSHQRKKMLQQISDDPQSELLDLSFFKISGGISKESADNFPKKKEP